MRQMKKHICWIVITLLLLTGCKYTLGNNKDIGGGQENQSTSSTEPMSNQDSDITTPINTLETTVEPTTEPSVEPTVEPSIEPEELPEELAVVCITVKKKDVFINDVLVDYTSDSDLENRIQECVDENVGIDIEYKVNFMYGDENIVLIIERVLQDNHVSYVEEND